MMNSLIQTVGFFSQFVCIASYSVSWNLVGAKDSVTIRSARFSTTFWALYVFEDVWRLVWREKPVSHFLPHRLTPVQLTETINFDFISNNKGLIFISLECVSEPWESLLWFPIVIYLKSFVICNKTIYRRFRLLASSLPRSHGDF